MSKYRITNVPDTQPGRCANCGSSQRDSRKYLDIGLDLEFYGIVVFCSLCIEDFVRTLGLNRALEVKMLQLEEKIAELQGRHDLGEELKNTVLLTFDRVKEYFDGNSRDLTSSDVFTISDSASRAADQSPDAKAIRDDNKTATGTKSGSVKPTTVSGSKNVPSLTELIESRIK